jgi:hypothetical protein
MDAQRKAALDAIVARGDKALADGNVEQARAALTLAAAIDPGDASVRGKLEALRPSMFALTEEERAFMTETIGRSDAGDWCTFPEPTPRMEVIALRMLSDARLLPSLRVTNLSFRREGCTFQGVFIFMVRPAMSIAEVRQTYGAPQQEATKDGGGPVLTYGPIRMVGTKDGAIQSVVLTPFL